MSYKVTFTSSNNYGVKYTTQNKYKTNVGFGITVMPQYLDELIDVEITGNPDKYVLMYDATTGKWKNVNPDDVLVATVTEPVSPGIPDPFVDVLDVDLDNRIDLDAGSF